MKRIAYEVLISEGLLGRVRTICAETGVTESTFIEAAIFDRTMLAERSPVIRDALTKDEESHPYQCACTRRFRLAAHLANHQKKCSRLEPPAPQPNRVVEPSPMKGPQPVAVILDEVQKDAIDKALETEEFKLAVDPALVELDGPARGRAQPDTPKIQDFGDDVPEL